MQTAVSNLVLPHRFITSFSSYMVVWLWNIAMLYVYLLSYCCYSIETSVELNNVKFIIPFEDETFLCMLLKLVAFQVNVWFFPVDVLLFS